MNNELNTTLQKAQAKANGTNPQLAKRIAQIYDELKTMNTINTLDNSAPDYGSPNIAKFAKPAYNEEPIVEDDSHTIHTFKIDIKAPKGEKFPTADVMKAVSEAVNSLGTTSENEIGDLEVMGFSYQKNDKEGSKKR
jgi:hypothetical protein